MPMAKIPIVNAGSTIGKIGLTGKAKYKKLACTSSGVLRINSMNHKAGHESHLLFDLRITASTNPNMIANRKEANVSASVTGMAGTMLDNALQACSQFHMFYTLPVVTFRSSQRKKTIIS